MPLQQIDDSDEFNVSTSYYSVLSVESTRINRGNFSKASTCPVVGVDWRQRSHFGAFSLAGRPLRHFKANFELLQGYVLLPLAGVTLKGVQADSREISFSLACRSPSSYPSLF